jgi:hypothetical protein
VSTATRSAFTCATTASVRARDGENVAITVAVCEDVAIKVEVLEDAGKLHHFNVKKKRYHMALLCGVYTPGTRRR